MSTGIKLNLNEVALNTLGAAMRNMLLEAVETINLNFASLSGLDEDARKERLIDLLGLDETDTTKIKKSQKKTPATTTEGKKPRTAKPKEPKACPLPIWGAKTVNLTKCNALTSSLYSQCLAECVEGSKFCAKCKKDFDNNGTISKRGTIDKRLHQFRKMTNDSHNIYKTPDGKKHKIYVRTWIEKSKGKYTIDNLHTVLGEMATQLSEEELAEMMYVPEKKTKKGKKITDGMGKKPADDENEEENEDEDECGSEATDMTYQTDDDDVPEIPDDEDDESLKKPEPAKPEAEPEPEAEAEFPDENDDEDEAEDEEEPVEIKELPYKGSSEYYRPIKLSGKMYLISTEEEKLGKECKLYETNFIEKERRSGEKTFTVGRVVGQFNKKTNKMSFK